MGIRPEDVKITPGDMAADGLAAGVCLTAEPLGSETLDTIDMAPDDLRVLHRETHVSLPEGSRTAVQTRAKARVHVFDTQSGTRLISAIDRDGAWHVTETADARARQECGL